MNSKIFPAAIIQNTVELYDSKISVKSKVIYLILLGVLVVSLVSLPLIFLDVAVQSRGTFQSSLQRNQLTSSVGGRLELWNISENKKVQKGDLLAVVRGEVLNLEMAGANERLSVIQDFIRDLTVLVKSDIQTGNIDGISLKSNFYRASLLEFQSKLVNQNAVVEKLERDFKRAQILLDSKSIAFAEYDNVDVQYRQATTQLMMIKKQKINEWEQELVSYQNESQKLRNQLEVISEQQDQYKIFAGTTGTLINVVNLNLGDFVHPNQKLAEISADTSLLAVTYVSPADIAFVQKNQQVSFQVDSYNYNQWGIADGKVVEIADDLSFINDREVGFLVTCLLDKPYLKLPTGQEGKIKKGMTFNGRFVIARRSLYQLLYDKVDNWLNPYVQSSNREIN